MSTQFKAVPEVKKGNPLLVGVVVITIAVLFLWALGIPWIGILDGFFGGGGGEGAGWGGGRESMRASACPSVLLSVRPPPRLPLSLCQVHPNPSQPKPPVRWPRRPQAKPSQSQARRFRGCGVVVRWLCRNRAKQARAPFLRQPGRQQTKPSRGCGLVVARPSPNQAKPTPNQPQTKQLCWKT